MSPELFYFSSRRAENRKSRTLGILMPTTKFQKTRSDLYIHKHKEALRNFIQSGVLIIWSHARWCVVCFFHSSDTSFSHLVRSDVIAEAHVSLILLRHDNEPLFATHKVHDHKKVFSVADGKIQ